jgi:oligopeptide transport system permease protein
VLLGVMLFAFAGPPLAARFGLDGTTPDAALGAAPPARAHPAGTDVLGRDLLVRTMEGGRVALRVGLFASAVAVLLGVAWGGGAGLAGGLVDGVMMRVVDVLSALPQTVFVLVIMAIVSSRSELLLVLLIGGSSWLTLARIVRAQVRALRGREHVLAARALGVGPARLLGRHILPAALGPIVVYAVLLVPGAFLEEAFLSFLGLGVPPPTASWGTLVQEGAGELAAYPWLLAVPASVMALTILALAFLGDALRDALDPETRRR